MTGIDAASSHPVPPRRGAAAVVAGLALVAVAVAAICAAALAVVADARGTFVDLGAHGTYRTDRYGLVTDATNWRTELFGWAGSVRLRVAPARREPIFVGVAAPPAISRYLRGAGYTTIAEHAGPGIVRSDHAGGRPALPPTTAASWTAHAEGTGTQTLRWNATAGRQIVLAMNADGSRPVAVRVVSSAVTLDRMPWWIPVAAVAFGLLLLLPGIRMLDAVRAATRGEPGD